MITHLPRSQGAAAETPLLRRELKIPNSEQLEGECSHWHHPSPASWRTLDKVNIWEKVQHNSCHPSSFTWLLITFHVAFNL